MDIVGLHSHSQNRDTINAWNGDHTSTKWTLLASILTHRKRDTIKGMIQEQHSRRSQGTSARTWPLYSRTVRGSVAASTWLLGLLTLLGTAEKWLPFVEMSSPFNISINYVCIRFSSIRGRDVYMHLSFAQRQQHQQQYQWRQRRSFWSEDITFPFLAYQSLLLGVFRIH